MAKVTGPLMSMTASGTLGDAIVFSTWKGRPYVRQHVKPANPKSAGQIAIRAVFAGSVAIYKSLNAITQATWIALGASMSITALNAFVQTSIKRFGDGGGPLNEPDQSGDAVLLPPTFHSPTVAGKQVSINITAPAGIIPMAYFVYRSKTAAFSPSPGAVVKLLPGSSNVFIDSPGTGTWYYAAASSNASGVVGAPTTDCTAVVS